MNKLEDKVAFIDMEGVLIPEIWPFLANQLQIPELKITTRDVADYQKLMQQRIHILKANNITLVDIQRCMYQLKTLDGATKFLESLQQQGFDIQIVSDCFSELLTDFLINLQLPASKVHCHQFILNDHGFIDDVSYSRKHGKQEIVNSDDFGLENSIAIGDAFNDFSMLKAVTQGYLFRPSETVRQSAPDGIKVVWSYDDVIKDIES